MKKTLLLLLISTNILATTIEASGETQFTFYGAEEHAKSNAITNAQEICLSDVHRLSEWNLKKFLKVKYHYSHYGSYDYQYKVLFLKATATFECI